MKRTRLSRMYTRTFTTSKICTCIKQTLAACVEIQHYHNHGDSIEIQMYAESLSLMMSAAYMVWYNDDGNIISLEFHDLNKPEIYSYLLGDPVDCRTQMRTQLYRDNGRVYPSTSHEICQIERKRTSARRTYQQPSRYSSHRASSRSVQHLPFPAAASPPCRWDESSAAHSPISILAILRPRR